MSALVILLALAMVAVTLLRRLLLHKPVRPPASEHFDGVIHVVGAAAIAERFCDDPWHTVICVPGYCENARYFTDYYADPTIQFIALISADYHAGLICDHQRSAAWATVPDAQAGSIEYDAHVLAQALKRLPASKRIRVHGHSRGGAVILEAAAMQPDAFDGVDVVLETPVLPQASLIRPLPALFYWLLPLFAPFWRRWPLFPLMRDRWGAMGDPRKRALIESMPFNAKRSATLIANLKSIERWLQERKTELYYNLAQGTILIADNDLVLDPISMRKSARSAGKKLQVVRVSQASHFLLLDRPDAIPPLHSFQETTG